MPSAPSRHDDPTEHVERPPAEDTQEMPSLEPDGQPDGGTATGPLPGTVPAETRPVPGPAQRPRPARPAAAPRRRQGLPLLVALAALSVVVGGGLGWAAGQRTPVGAAPAAASTVTPVPIDAKVSSVDPSGGSGLRRDGDGWRTQTYRSARFGGLKPGVGLLLDLGSSRRVTSVTLTATPPGATVGLRAADSAPTSGETLPAVGRDVTVDGKVVLDASSGGSHRYWLVWVSDLGARGDGYGVTLGDPVVSGPAS